MHESYGVRLFAVEESSGLGFAEGFTPGLAGTDYGRAVAAAHLNQALGKVAGGEDREFLAGLDEIGEYRFHAGAAGAGDYLHEGILGSENGTKVATNFFVDFEEERVEMTDDGLTHSFVNSGMNLGGAGSEEQATRRI